MASPFTASISLVKSGTTEHAADMVVPASSPGSRTQSISADIYLTQFQTIQLRAYQSSGVNQTIICNRVSGKFTFLDGRRVY